MNKEFNEILEQLGFYFNPDNILKQPCIIKSDLMELLEKAFNLGLEVAADNAEADFNRPDGQTVECYVLKNSILQHKL